ncbi:glycosyltransferase [Novosphingobium jiangmenense]|uniref:Glycosyltransferase n=1 Tax=Novosphingobium jiangmenense TaxID=2791981 RepID=A0ABS0HLB9_9SPHN|nr:glycosyltransferase [Novosphingobium jiangmenense]MBF9153052.1 glycosyltransferase [Novosphingobium jiangmenense]
MSRLSALPPPLVTTIIPAYNHETYVADAIGSVIAQSHPNMEIVIIDDGSSDGTRTAIERKLSATPSHHRIIFETQDNAGVCATLNRGLQLSSGEFIQFLASDDMYLPEKTSHCLRGFGGLDEAFAATYCDGLVIDQNGRRIGKFSDIYPRPISKNNYRELLVSNWIPAMGLLYKAAALHSLGGFDENLKFEDWDLLLRLSRRYKIHFVGQELFEYRLHGDNLHNNMPVMLDGLEAMFAKHPRMNSFQEFVRAGSDRSMRRLLRTVSPGNAELYGRLLLRRARTRRI